MSAAVMARDLVKSYPKGVRALDHLSLHVEAGEILGLLGPNGAGKSTTVKILTTLARADSGRAEVMGHDVAKDPARVRRVIGVVAQRSGLDPAATGRDNLTLQGRLFGLRGTPLRRRVDELLERFDLTAAANRLTRGWSGGMQRRLDVAMGLIHRPAVLFLDEPTTGLDPEGRAVLWREIRSLEGIAILLTTHYLDEADRLADRLAIVDGGKVVAEGTPDHLKGELRGDSVLIELLDPPKSPLHLPGLRELTVDGRRLSARADDGAAAVPGALAALESRGLGVATVTVARPSLDDVYLKHAGRRLEVAA
ncbi:ATP-binding cassette domain-containing protein [Dactylosporangium vinaceum]|uniref:ATP-binding cassette domain-containing protein n=1 Tax=Dactylosporangium vinaceum TaxID=53362 RepID=A0ABV5M8I0_9ACTN|nr:ATP-binding cassette domain-containing protein [Dactylosporangium vinaceum]UAB94582.1 ATP-binding cassette domain-containing protein [Dactylosporangium vinaceum]